MAGENVNLFCTIPVPYKYVGGKKGTYIWETQSNQNLIKVQ